MNRRADFHPPTQPHHIVHGCGSSERVLCFLLGGVLQPMQRTGRHMLHQEPVPYYMAFIGGYITCGALDDFGMPHDASDSVYNVVTVEVSQSEPSLQTPETGYLVGLSTAVSE